MKRLALLLILAATPAVADECDALAARIVAETGATLDRRTDTMIHLNHPLARSMSLDCSAEPWVRKGGGIFVSSAAPSPAAYDLAAKLAEISASVRYDQARSTFKRCQQQALRSADGTATVETKIAQFNCTASTKNGVSGLMVSRSQ